jgi:hypothetical protein
MCPYDLPVSPVVACFCVLFDGSATLNVGVGMPRKSGGVPFQRGYVPWNSSIKAPILFGSTAAAGPQAGAHALSARRPTSSSSTRSQPTHKAPRLHSPVAQPEAASAMPVTERRLEATLATIFAAAASSLPPTPPTPSTTSKSDTAVTPLSSPLGRASSSSEHASTAPALSTRAMSVASSSTVAESIAARPDVAATHDGRANQRYCQPSHHRSVGCVCPCRRACAGTFWRSSCVSAGGGRCCRGSHGCA